MSYEFKEMAGPQNNYGMTNREMAAFFGYDEDTCDDWRYEDTDEEPLPSMIEVEGGGFAVFSDFSTTFADEEPPF